MKLVLESLIPKILPLHEGIHCRYISHEGKQDLEKSIPRKLRAWKKPYPVKFIIVRDQDSTDCHEVKRNLKHLCAKVGTPKICLVNIVKFQLKFRHKYHSYKPDRKRL